MSFSDEEIAEFKTEVTELLEVAETNLLEINSGKDYKTKFDAVFRSLHNIKGGAGMMELVALQAHTHELESLFMKFKETESIPEAYINMFLKGVDASRSILDGQSINFNYTIEDNLSETSEADNSANEEVNIIVNEVINADSPESIDSTESLDQSMLETLNSAAQEAGLTESEIQLQEQVEALVGTEAEPTVAQAPVMATDEFLAECEEIIEHISTSLQAMESNVSTKETIDALYRDIHSLKGAAYLFSYQNLGDLTHSIESSLESVRTGTHKPSKLLINVLYKSIQVIELELKCIKKNAANPQMPQLVAGLQKALNVAVAKLEEAEPSESIILEVSQKMEEHSSAPPAAAAVVKPSSSDNSKESSDANSTIRVSVALLDSLMTLIGEMVLVRNQVLQFANTTSDLEFGNLSKRLNLVTSEIQGELMKTRMQPIGNILGKFTRVVRDLSQELGKKISLELNGSETELDKSLLEAIKDPLTHIVRNSCDHGIEMPEVRRQAGKPADGHVSIRSYHEGGQVVIEVADDGKGLSKEVLIRKGIEKGLITEAQSKLMSEKEILNLIFAPGFSTAKLVTNVSGRGVGMDVVRTNIERIGGTVELSSVEGKGTKIWIKIPLTLAIVPALIVNSEKNIFAIPQVKLVELVRVDQSSENQIEYLQEAPVYRLRGDILPLVDLNKVLNIHADTKYEDRVVNIAVLNAEHCSFGLIIDEIQDTADIVVKPLNRLLKSLQVYSGATVLGDGSVALILDVLGLSKVAQVGKEQESAKNKADEFKAVEQSNAQIQDFLLLKVNSPTKHAIVLGYVHRLEEFSKSDIEYSGDQRVLRYRGAILPLISMNQSLSYPTPEPQSENEKVAVVVIERAGRNYGIEVDEILDTLSTTIEVQPSMGARPGIYGNLSTEEELIVVADPFEIIQQAFPENKSVMAKGKNVISRAHEKTGPIKILFAEDTAFFRKAVSRVLESAGYQVILANDGQEAMDLLSTHGDSIDIIISDIEMPKMNGFKLAEAVRANPNFEHIPLLAVSSRADSTYVQNGVSSGFNFYLEKLKPELLLKTVADLMSASGRAA